MWDLESEIWIAVIFATLVIIPLRITYSLKYFSRLHQKQPSYCLLPKYRLSLPLNSAAPSQEEAAIEEELDALLTELGFTQTHQDENFVSYRRGNPFFGFSINSVCLIVAAKLPLTNPVDVRVRYRAVTGVLFDTGDLWRFCQDLKHQAAVCDSLAEMDMVAPTEEEDEMAPNAPPDSRSESDNPFQSPLD